MPWDDSEDAVFDHAVKKALDTTKHHDVERLRAAAELARCWVMAQAQGPQQKYTALKQRFAERTSGWAGADPVLWRWVFLLVIPTFTWTLVPLALGQDAAVVGKFALLFLGVSLVLVVVSYAWRPGQLLGRIWALVGVSLPVWMAGGALVAEDGASQAWSAALAVVCVVMAYAMRTAVSTVLPTKEIIGLTAAVDQALEQWRSAVLNKGVLPVLRAELRSQEVVPGTKLAYRNAEGLRRGGSPVSHQPVPAGRKLADLVRGMNGGTFALAGPPGSGRTSLLEAFCGGAYRRPEEPLDLAVMVSAPVDHVPGEFVLHLYARTCQAVLSHLEDAQPLGPARARLVQAARRALQDIAFVPTRTAETSGKLGFGGAEISYKREVSLTGRPATFPELVDHFRGFVRLAARTLAPTRVVIAIDEVDRVNELKPIFGVPGCHYLISVSTEARHDLFDEVVRVDHLDFDLAKGLISRSVEGLPDSFVALAHVLSGGLPRQLIRTARAIVREGQGTTLAAVTEKLIADERGHELIAVVRDYFTDDLTEVVPAHVDALARARRHAGSDPATSLALLAEFSAAASERPAPARPPR